MKIAFGWGQKADGSVDMLTAKKRTILISSVLVFVFGCQDPNEVAQSWVGRNVNDLIAQKGAPNQVIDNGKEGKIMVWRNGASYEMPGAANTTYGYTGAHTNYYPGQTMDFSFVWTFWVDSQDTIYRASYVSR